MFADDHAHGAAAVIGGPSIQARDLDRDVHADRGRDGDTAVEVDAVLSPCVAAPWLPFTKHVAKLRCEDLPVTPPRGAGGSALPGSAGAPAADAVASLACRRL
jgi:hypothetical protein